MPLIPCPDCGRQISDRAPSCLDCGAPIAAQAAAPLAPAAREVTIANQKYALPALLQFFMPLPGLGQFVKGHNKKGKEFMLGTLIWIPGLVIVGVMVPSIAAMTVALAILFFLYLWGKAVIDAYNSHDDNVEKMLADEPQSEAGEKAA